MLFKDDFFICKTKELMSIKFENTSLTQNKIFNTFIFMVQHGDKFKINNYHDISNDVKNNLNTENNLELIDNKYIISFSELSDLLLNISNANILNSLEKLCGVKLNKYDYKIAVEKPLSMFINDIIIIKNKYIIFSASSFFIDILKTKLINYSHFKLSVLNNFHSLYSLKLYEDIYSKITIPQKTIITYNNKFIYQNRLGADYENKLNDLNNNIKDYMFINPKKIKSYYIREDLSSFLTSIGMNVNKLSYKTGNIKYLFDKIILNEINSQFIAGLNNLIANKKLAAKIKNKKFSNWIFPDILIRCIWLKQSKIKLGDSRKLSHLLIQFYSIKDINIDLLLKNEKPLDNLNFHCLEKLNNKAENLNIAFDGIKKNNSYKVLDYMVADGIFTNNKYSIKIKGVDYNAEY